MKCFKRLHRLAFPIARVMTASLPADESTVKLNEAGMYSTEYLQSSHLEQDQEQQKQKSKSRWKWGKKRTPINTSRESLEAGNERSRSTFMMTMECR